MNDDKRYWFPAKPYGAGYGWGLPITWQGWVVLVTYLLLVIGAGTFLALYRGAVFVIFLAVITVAFLAICVWKGEPQRTRDS
jgi:hypothetical protein